MITTEAAPGSLTRRQCCLALAAAAAGPDPAAATVAAAAPPLPLAREWPRDGDPSGFLVSEKYDGVRAYWDGRSLVFRSGRPIAAPRWFTDLLPARPLDGELWLGRGRFEALSAIVRRQQAVDAEWRSLQYRLFELPAAAGDFEARVRALQALVGGRPGLPLEVAPQSRIADRAALQRRLDDVVAGGGEGLMLHRADAPYVAGRAALLFKHKPLHDAEALVLARLPGQGRLAGRMGALQVRTDAGISLQIGCGFSDAQRASPPAPGQRITFTHRGLTAQGVPRFASFLRMAPDF